MFRVRTQYSSGLLGHVPGLRMLIMKSKEWIIAVKLELIYSKKEILTMYANTVDFGNNSFGVKTAAKTYFNTSPSKLSIDQAATLVGMLKATTYYNPILHPKNSIRRRNTVLYNMVTHNVLPHDEYALYSKRPMKLDIHVEENYDGQAQYFREYISEYFKDWMKDNGYEDEVQVFQSKVSEEVNRLDEYDVVISTTVVPDSVKDKVIMGLPLLTGMGIDSLWNELKQALEMYWVKQKRNIMQFLQLI